MQDRPPWSEAGYRSARAEKGWKKGQKAIEKGWTGSGVRQVLANPRYAGIRVYNGEEMGQGDWGGILELEQTLALTALFTSPTRKPRNSSRSGRKPASLLTQIGDCSVCDAKVRATSNRKGPVYGCKSGHATVDREYVDLRVQGEVIDRLSRPDALTLFAGEGDGAVEAKAEVEKWQAKLSRLAQLLAEDTMTEEQFATGTATARGKLAEAEAKLSKYGAGTLLVGLDVGTGKVKEQWKALGLERKRAVIKALLSIKLRPQGRGKAVIPPEDQVVITDL